MGVHIKTCASVIALAALMPLQAQQALGQTSKGRVLAEAEIAHPPPTLSLSGKEAVALAQKLYNQGRLDEAETILQSLVDADPEKVDVVQIAFLAGLIAMRRGQYKEAEEIFRTILDHDPGLVRIRLELAKTLFEQKKDGAATYHFQLALANDLPDPVRKKIRAFLAKIEARRLVTISWSSSIAPSTNINSGTELDSISGLLGSEIIFRPSEDRKAQSGIGFSNSISASALPKLGKNWRLEVRGSLRLLDYKQVAFDDASATFEIGPRFQNKNRTVSILATTNKRQFGGKDYSKSLGARLVLSTPLSKRNRVALRGSYSYARYLAISDRNGPIYTASGSFQRALSKKSTLALSLQATRQEARAASQKNSQIGLSASYRRELPHGITIQLSPQFFYRTYDGIDPLFPTFKERIDTTSGISLYLTKRDWRFMSFAPVISYSYLINDSSNEFYSYKRHSADVGVTRKF
jgi:outer membrane protein